MVGTSSADAGSGGRAAGIVALRQRDGRVACAAGALVANARICSICGLPRGQRDMKDERKCSEGAALATGLVALLCTMEAGRAADYPTRPVTPGGGVHPGRAERRAGPHPRQEARADPRAAVRDRQPAGRRRQHRGRGRRPCGARRLHAAQRQQQHPRHQRGALPEDQLRPAGGLRADRPDRLAGQYPGGESGGAGAHDGRADRARQGQSRQDQFRLLGPRRRPRISPASCSRSRPRSTSSTCPTRARRRRCRT